MEEYKINKKWFWVKICIITFCVVIFTIFMIWVAVFNTPEISKDTDILITFITILIILDFFFYFYPTYAFYSQYRFEKDVVFYFDKNTGNCIYTKGKKSIKFNISDIKYYYRSHSIRRFYSEYDEIVLNSGAKIFISEMIKVPISSMIGDKLIRIGKFFTHFPKTDQNFWLDYLSNKKL